MLVTRTVFIDTEFFVRANFDFNSTTIKSFEELCSSNELNHITSTIVVNEVKRKICNRIKEVFIGIKNCQRKAVFLKAFDDNSIKSFFTGINQRDLEDKALTAYNNFIKASNTVVVDMKGVDGNEIINMFFNQTSPFSEKKPNEFRDAFSLLAIRSALKEKEKVYVISADVDHKNFCEGNEQFISVEALDELLDVYNKHKHRERITKYIDQFLEHKKVNIKQKIKTQLEEADGYNSSTWDYSEVEEFKVIEIEDDDIIPKIIHMDDESCQITFDVTVRFLVKVSGPDTINGHYDKEYDFLYTFCSSERQEEEEINFSVELDLFFETNKNKLINDEFDLHIKGLSGGIEFGVEETSWEDPRF